MWVQMGLLRRCSGNRRFHDSNVVVVNALMDFYSSYECFVGARKSFAGIKVEDVIS